MLLLEFAAQGIRGVAPAGGRATLRPGYNVVAADGPTLRRLLEALFYPDPKDGDALPRTSGGPANAPVRAGVTVIGDDRVTYRLVRDFAAGAQLHRFDPERRSFALVSQDLAEIAELMQRSVGVPPPSRLGALLAVCAADLPSRQAGAGALPVAAPHRPSLTPEQTRRRVEALRDELAKARVAEKLQAEQDGLADRSFRLEEVLRGGERLREELEKAEEALHDHGPAADLLKRLGDPEARVAAYEKALAKRDDAAAKVAAEREAIAQAEEVPPPPPFWRAPSFWAGAGAGIVLAAAGVAGAIARSDLRYVALLDIGAFGWAAWVALRWIGGEEARDRFARRKRIVDDWERKIEAQWQKDAADVLEAVKALRDVTIPGSIRPGVTKPSELGEALARAREASERVAEATKQLAAWEGSPEIAAARAEKPRVEDALRTVEAQLSREVGGFVRDSRSVEMEIQRLEAEMAAPHAPAATPPPTPQPAGDPLRTLVAKAAVELGGSPTAAVRAVAQKASQTLSGLSFQRMQALQVDDRANLHVQIGGRPTPAVSLSPADRDLVFFALKLAFLEQALAAGRVVAVSDDAFAGLSEGARRFAARLLKQIARPGQIVHATTDPSFREAADHAA